MTRHTDNLPDRRWIGLRWGCRQLRVWRVVALTIAVVAAGLGAALYWCQPVWLSVAAYALIFVGLLYGGRSVFRLGLGANSDALESPIRPDRSGAERFNLDAVKPLEQRRLDALAAMFGLALTGLGLTLSTFLLPVLQARDVFACAA